MLVFEGVNSIETLLPTGQQPAAETPLYRRGTIAAWKTFELLGGSGGFVRAIMHQQQPRALLQSGTKQLPLLIRKILQTYAREYDYVVRPAQDLREFIERGLAKHRSRIPAKSLAGVEAEGDFRRSYL